jgi:hypothetical protein
MENGVVPCSAGSRITTNFFVGANNLRKLSR